MFNFKDLFLAILKALKVVGVGWTLFTLFLITVMWGIFNYKTIILDGIEIYEKVRLEKHEKEMLVRDELLNELDPLLREFRASAQADRLLYFEYHNSKENLVGIPFKYVDLVLSEKKYGVPGISNNKYKDINAGLITELYRDVIRVGYVINDDPARFYEKYSGVSDFLKDNENKQQLFINIPGVTSPIGLIILEWLDDDTEGQREIDWVEQRHHLSQFVPRINALIINKSNK